MNMRPLWTFLFLGCLLITCHAVLEDLRFGSAGITKRDDYKLDTGFLLNAGESITSANLPASVTLTPPRNIMEASQDIMDQLDQHEMIPSGSLDASNITSQEGLLGAVILDNLNLGTERQELQKILLGGTTSFGIKNDLLEAAGTKAVEGLVCKGSLGGLCGHGSLSGMKDVLENMNSEKLKNWLNVTRFDIIQLSWKVFASSSLELKFQTRLTINLSGLLSFLSGFTVDVNIVVPLDLQQIEPGQVSFSVKSCQALLTGIQVKAGKFSTVMETIMKWSLNISLPNILCPVVRFWFHIINQQLAIMTNIAPSGMLNNSNLASIPQPMLYERSYRMDLKNKPFPASFINWLIEMIAHSHLLPVASLELGFSLTGADQGKASTDMYVNVALLQVEAPLRTNQTHVLEKGLDSERPSDSDSERDLQA